MNAYAKTLSVVVLAALPAGLALAQEAGCIELATTAQVERTVTGADGKPHTQLVPATTVVPGTEVIWTITATNVCAQPAGNVAIDSPVPEHMLYVEGSAAAAAVTVSYSIDGKRYGGPGALVVRDADGTTRTARPDEYRHVRYAIRAALAPGESLSASHRTRVQ